MAKNAAAPLQAPQTGHNYDAVQRAEFIRDYYEGRLENDDLRRTDNEAHKARVKANSAKLNTLNIPIADSEDGYRKFKLRKAIENAKDDEARQSAENRLAANEANTVECMAAAAGKEQLSFHDIMARGETARATEAKTKDQAKTTEQTPAAGAKKTH